MLLRMRRAGVGAAFCGDARRSEILVSSPRRAWSKGIVEPRRVGRRGGVTALLLIVARAEDSLVDLDGNEYRALFAVGVILRKKERSFLRGDFTSPREASASRFGRAMGVKAVSWSGQSR